MPRMLMLLIISLLAMVTGGCQVTYIPVSWGIGDKVQSLSRTDPTLATLYNHYDPDRKTLRVDGVSFEEVMMPSEVDQHLGAYRPDTRLIYRNLYKKFSDQDLRDLLVHEFAHYIWATSMSSEQHEQWRQYLLENPTPLQDMVRRVYPSPAQYDTEDFAFVLEYPRPIDIEELTTLNVVTTGERDAILKEPRMMQVATKPPSQQRPQGTQGDAGSKVAKTAPEFE